MGLILIAVINLAIGCYLGYKYCLFKVAKIITKAEELTKKASEIVLNAAKQDQSLIMQKKMLDDQNGIMLKQADIIEELKKVAMDKNARLIWVMRNMRITTNN